MTTEQIMLECDARGVQAARSARATAEPVVHATRVVALLLALVVMGALPGCAKKDKLVVPVTLLAPYDTSRGDVLWAVVPLRNESGTSIVDTSEVSDKVVAAAAQVRGVRTLPLNRTIATMRALGMTELASPADARRLATEMGVDGLVLGSVTAWDPYDPPTLGLALALYLRPGSLEARSGLDVRALRYQPTDYQYFPRSAFTDAPSSVISEHLDGKNHQVQMDLRRYATGRHDPATALGWRRYLASMDLFSEFASWHAVERLLEHEAIRLLRVQSGEVAATGR
jgi:hypothetical protein